MMRILLFLTLGCIFCTCFGQDQTCSRGPHNLTRFGPSCEFMCHCSGQQCDINTGECPDGLECDPGWMGSGCQYVNIAYHVSVQSNLWNYIGKVVDGNKSTCSMSTSPNGETAFLNLDFGRIVKIIEVHLIFLNTVPSFNVSIFSPRDINLCSIVLKNAEQERYIVMCGSPLYRQMFNITLQGPNLNSTLCELQIPAGRNMAYGKTANQSTTFENYTAVQAVDGSFSSGSSSLASGTCTHTNISEAPWWLLNLETYVVIQWFRIYNRQNESNIHDDLQGRLNNFRIFLSEDNKYFSEVYQDQSNHLAVVIETSLNFDFMARFVKIELNGTNRTLTLCEVQVFGDCNDTYYGNCTAKCGHCRFPAICDKINGSCPSGLCSEGWYGDKCDTEIGLAENRGGNNSIQPSILGGSIGGAVAIIGIIITIIIILIVKRRNPKRLQSTAETMRYLSRETNEGLVYENSTFINSGNDIRQNQGMSEESNKSFSSTTPKQAKATTKLITKDPEAYYNVGRVLPAGTVLLSMFWDYVQEKFIDDRFLPKEFEELPSGLQFPTTIALRPENKNKNRYKQLYAYDVNRVTLKPMGDDSSDYINASFIDGYSRQKMYIASQGATKENINDFWRMLWQYHVEKIVMLTELFEGGRHKCELYWPEEEGQTRTFGSIDVRLLVTDAFADYNIRRLEMSVGKISKQLTQFHFSAWPDKGVPKAASSMVQFWNTVNKVTTNEPIVVHCSAGIGRTGTYIALDYLVNQGKAEGQVNVSACVSNLRRQRVNLVQTQEQYLFLHETLMEALMLSGTATTSDNFPKVYDELLEFDPVNRKFKLQLEYERLQNEVVNHEAVYATIKKDDEEEGEENSNQDEFSAAKHIENRVKNRHDNILPADRHRVFLSTPVLGRNDYINAVVLASHKERKAFIMTQMPLTNTIIDFWRMIKDFEIKTIIMFNSESSKTDNIGIYWPKEGEAQIGPFSVKLKKQENCKNYIERTLSFSLIGEEHERSVKQFQFTNWDKNSNVPGSTDSILQLMCDVETWQKETEAKPVVVHCLNGAQRSGLYCVISTVIERLKVERDVAITQTIKRARAIRQQVIPNYEQFQFCHECILQYMKTFETYSNF